VASGPAAENCSQALARRRVLVDRADLDLHSGVWRANGRFGLTKGPVTRRNTYVKLNTFNQLVVDSNPAGDTEEDGH